mmetsp:Transcript_17543/g.31670  ORF Transcript_17543/g.31670 Transcript_17543/m.31670 type:complete len:351 (-) Transcript_17543:169-1221(-)
MSWKARVEIKSVGVQSEIDGSLLDKATEYFQHETESRWKDLASFVQTPKADSAALLLPVPRRVCNEGHERELGSTVGALSGASVVSRLMEQRVSIACQAQEMEVQSLRARVATLLHQVEQRDRIIEELLTRGGWQNEADALKARADGICTVDAEEEDDDDVKDSPSEGDHCPAEVRDRHHIAITPVEEPGTMMSTTLPLMPLRITPPPDLPGDSVGTVALPAVTPLSGQRGKNGSQLTPNKGSVSAPLDGSLRKAGIWRQRRADRYLPSDSHYNGWQGRPKSAEAPAARPTVGHCGSHVAFSVRISSGAGVKTIAVPIQESPALKSRRTSKQRSALHATRALAARSVEVY